MDLFNQLSRGMAPNVQPFQQPQQQRNLPAFNQQQFTQIAMTLDRASLERLVQMARMQGISDADISAGLNIINSLR